MRPRIALMVCSHASLRDDRQMARRPASHVQRQKEAIRKVRARTEWREAVLRSSGTGLRGRGLSCCAGCIQLDARPHCYFDRQRRVDCSGLRARSGASAGYLRCGSCSHISRRLCRSEVLLCESISPPLFSLRLPAQCLLSSWPNYSLRLLVLPHLGEGTRLRGRAATLRVQTPEGF